MADWEKFKPWMSEEAVRLMEQSDRLYKGTTEERIISEVEKRVLEKLKVEIDDKATSAINDIQDAIRGIGK